MNLYQSNESHFKSNHPIKYFSQLCTMYHARHSLPSAGDLIKAAAKSVPKGITTMILDDAPEETGFASGEHGYMVGEHGHLGRSSLR